MPERAKLQKRINAAKTSIILVAVLTIANTILIAADANISFTFSAYVPQLVTYMFAEIAAQEQIKSYLYIGIAIALFMALIYVGLWFGSKKKNGFIVAALVLFLIDSALLLYDVISYADVSFIIDIAFHGWVIYDLVLGLSAMSKLKKLPPQEEIPIQPYSVDPNQAQYYNPAPQPVITEEEQKQKTDSE